MRRTGGGNSCVFIVGRRPYLPPGPVCPLFSGESVLTSCSRVAAHLTSSKIGLIFAKRARVRGVTMGHARGNGIFCSMGASSLMNCPATVEGMAVSNRGVSIEARRVSSFSFSHGNLSIGSCLGGRFAFFLGSVVSSATCSVSRLTSLTPDFDVATRAICGLGIPLGVVNALLGGHAIKTTTGCLKMSNGVSSEIHKVILGGLILRVVVGLCRNSRPFCPKAPRCKTVSTFVNEVGGLMEPFSGSNGVGKVLSTILSSVCSTPPRS